MNNMLGIWFCGLSDLEKSYASKFLEKLIKNSIKIDGDTVRKFLSSDLDILIKTGLNRQEEI